MNAKRSWKAEFEPHFLVDPSLSNQLLLGCGMERSKRIVPKGTDPEWVNLVTLDMSEDAQPDVLHDMNRIPLPFGDSVFDEIHAYEILEHTGHQGDFRFFLQQFADFWRVLKPGGFLCASVPMWDSPWAWGDPGHTRVITKGSLVFLSQDEYKSQVGKTAMSDYRPWYQANFETMGVQEDAHQMQFVLKAHK